MGAGGSGAQACLACAVPAEQLLKASAHEQRVVGRIPHVCKEESDSVEVARCARRAPAGRHTNLHHPCPMLGPVTKSSCIPAHRRLQLAAKICLRGQRGGRQLTSSRVLWYPEAAGMPGSCSCPWGGCGRPPVHHAAPPPVRW